jgi:hypothetical protein
VNEERSPRPDDEDRLVSQEHISLGSRSAEGAATRWEELHPEDEIEHEPPSAVPDIEEGVPNRHSASAEAASIRWREQHDED